jgi:hypothetical protein
MTFGDWIWATLALRHRPQYGLAHGALLCLWMGLYLGLLMHHVARGLAIGAVIGISAAGSFYALAPIAGYSAMFASWMLLWLGFAGLAAHLAGGRLSTAVWLLRALAAAVGSGVAFYAVSGIWTEESTARRYSWHFIAWAMAFLPGALALLAFSSAPGSRQNA